MKKHLHAFRLWLAGWWSTINLMVFHPREYCEILAASEECEAQWKDLIR